MSRPEGLVLAVLSVWALGPILVLMARALIHGWTFTGVIGLDPYDQYQELAWIREMGTHGLSSNLFGMTGGSHVFLQPMWFISGALWRLGIGLQASYLIWVPVSILALWGGLVVFARRMGETRWRQLAILVLALFFTSPIGWLNLPNTPWVAEMQLGLSDSSAALQPWLALHSAIALGVMAAVVVGYERLRARSDMTGRPTTLALWTALGAAAVGWLHSWQGITLLLLMLGLLGTRRPRRSDLILAWPLAGCALPLLYQFLLTRFDAAWRLAEQQNARPDLVVTTPQLAVLGPLLAVALVSLVRRWPRLDTADWILVLWPVAAVLTYRLDREFPPHALQGVSIPLAALAVRGWPTGRTAVAVGVAGIVAFTIPGLAYFAKTLSPTFRAQRPLFFQTDDEHAALAFLSHQASGGAVLAPADLALEVPGFTDLPVWSGHQVWTPNSPVRVQQTDAFYSGAMSRLQAQRLIRSTGVRWVVVDCPAAGAARTLAGVTELTQSVNRFGCAEIIRVRPPA